MEFANKEYFALLLLLIPYILWYFLYRKNSEPTMRMSATAMYRYAAKSWRIPHGGSKECGGGVYI